MKVLEYGEGYPKKIVCDECKSTLEYTIQDIKDKFACISVPDPLIEYANCIEKYLVCPVCNNYIILDYLNFSVKYKEIPNEKPEKKKVRNEMKQVDELAKLIGQAINHNSFLNDEQMETINIQGIIKELIAHGVVVQDVPDTNIGEWEKFHEECFICSCCAKVFGLGSLATLNDVKRVWKYCPNCGAKMTLEPPKGE